MGKTPPPNPDPLPPWVEGGFINDQSGQATEQVRQVLRKKKGNPILKKFIGG